MVTRIIGIIAAALVAAAPSNAQHSLTSGGQYDPRVPTPRSVLGYELGERFTPHHMLMRYIDRLAATSGRVDVDTVAFTFEGREVTRVILTSEANRQRLSDIRRDAQRLFDPRTASDAELSGIVRRMPSIAWLGYSVHGGEASGVEAGIGVLYQLAAGTDAETRMILDSLVVIIDPSQNPDGHERHVQDVTRARGALNLPTSPFAMLHQGNWPGPRTSHYYFDLNRDWFIHSHPETQGRVRTFMEWAPHVAVDLHEMGSNSTYFFAPPMDPFNKNVPEVIKRWWDVYAAANAEAMNRHGWPFFRREGYDEFYPGYGVSWPILNGAVGMTYEQASSAGGAIRRNDGTVLTLLDAAMHHYTTSMATLLATARRRDERVRDYLGFRHSAITDHARSRMRAVVIARDAHGRADSLAQRLIGNGIEVRRLRSATTLRDGTPYATNQSRAARVEAGGYVIDLAQPQGRLAKALLEPDAELDSTFITEELESRETNQPGRFYDVTAWSLPFMFRVNAWTTSSVPDGSEVVARDRPMISNVRLPPAAHGYAFAPGSETSLRMLSGLLRDSVRVWYARRWFRIGDRTFPNGAFIVRVAANEARVHELVRQHAGEGADVVALSSAAVDAGTDLGSNSVIPVRIPRVALVGGTGVNGNSFGFTWYTFDQRLRYPTMTVSGALLTNALEDVNVVVVPSVNSGAFDRELGDDGRRRLGDWVRNGGVLITLDGGTSWVANERLGIARLRLRTDTTRADSLPGAPLPASVPGAIVRVQADTLSPLLAGVDETSFGVLVFSDRILRAPRDGRYGEVVLRYAPRPQLRVAGYLWPEVPARLAGSPYLWTERVGRGRVIAFAGDPNFRDLWRGLLAVFGNAVFLGGSF